MPSKNQIIQSVKEIFEIIHSHIPIPYVLGVLFIIIILTKKIISRQNRRKRRNYYRNDYLKSDDWQRKRYVVLKRDHWRCRYCGNKATQVHHKRYAKYNIGREPIDWLVSVCKQCHEKQHE